ncbi:hypothetical protein BN2497_7381 [Janthinobacterium sp. CG23_2]|nr:hypothetical protein BN2497_7381 [Janthinobacterium sp. CG23_2]CUU30088.1 hypothetical protein BN3177_7381 [Janthinobacterium sp. CG23_2]
MTAHANADVMPEQLCALQGFRQCRLESTFKRPGPCLVMGCSPGAGLMAGLIRRGAIPPAFAGLLVPRTRRFAGGRRTR